MNKTLQDSISVHHRKPICILYYKKSTKQAPNEQGRGHGGVGVSTPPPRTQESRLRGKIEKLLDKFKNIERMSAKCYPKAISNFSKSDKTVLGLIFLPHKLIYCAIFCFCM